MQRPAWSPATHHLFPPRFKETARTLILVAHRGSHFSVNGSSGSMSTDRQQQGAERGGQPASRLAVATLLAAVPEDLLIRILGLAAYPLSNWLSPPGNG